MKYLNLFLFLLIFNLASYSQLIVTPITPQQAITDVLIGQGVVVTPGSVSIKGTATGADASIGKFKVGPSGVNAPFSALDSGIIITTGRASEASGSASVQRAFNSVDITDTELQSITTNTIRDGFVIQFSFTPESDTLRFQYIFSSEEYPEYAGSGFNDVFGFFLTGAKQDGTFYNNQNIALIPNTTTPVSINTVNNGTASSGPCMNCGYYVNNSSSTSIVYDGSTVVLTAYALVVRCTEYTIKLGVADVGDGSHDSGVFLKAGSFSTPKFTCNPLYPPGNTQLSLTEGCGSLDLRVTIPVIFPSGFTYDYQLAGTATNNVDYQIIPNTGTINFGPNQSSSLLTIKPILDNIHESTEYIIFQYPISVCDPTNFNNFDTIFLINQDSLTVKLQGDTNICVGQPAILTASITNGVLPYTFSWSTGDILTYPELEVPQTEQIVTYWFSAKDACDTVRTKEITVKQLILNLDARSDTTICEGNNVLLYSDATTSVVWEGLSGETPIVAPTETTTYTVNMNTPCGNMSDKTIVYVDKIPYFNLGEDREICPQKPIMLGADIENGVPATISWNINKFENWIKVNESGTYIMNAKNGKCAFSDTVVLTPSECDWWIPSAFTPNKDKNNLNETFRPIGVAPDNYELKIYNRWNELMFQTIDFKEGWDGKYNNNDVPQGVYFYQLLGNGYPVVQKKVLKQGKFTLIR